MMHIAVRDVARSEEFSSMLQELRNLVDVVEIQFDDKGMYLQTMDSSHVLLLEIVLPHYWFDVYEVPTPICIALQTGLLQKIFKIREKNMWLDWKVAEENNDVLMVKYYDKGCPPPKYEFALPLLDVSLGMLNIPEQEHDVQLKFKSSVFAEWIDKLNKFGGDTVVFKIAELQSSVLMYTSGALMESSTMTVDATRDTEEFLVTAGLDLSISVSLKYMKDIVSFQRIAECITLGITENMPLKLKYPLINLKNDGVENGDGEELLPHVTFYLAPKLDD